MRRPLIKTFGEATVYLIIMIIVAFTYFRAGRAMTSSEMADLRLQLDMIHQDVEWLNQRQTAAETVPLLSPDHYQSTR